VTRTSTTRIAAAIGLLAGGLAWSADSSLVLYNGKVYTADDARPTAEAVVATLGKIAFVGSSAEALKQAPKDAKRIDLQGRTVLPGLADAHSHVADIGFRELEFSVQGVASLRDLKDRLRDRAASTKPGDWLVGRGWLESRWTPPVFPTRQDLDEVVADRAVLLGRADGHALLANSLALKRAGINRSTPNPSGGEILKDPKTGEPTGMLVDRAMDLMTKLIPEPSSAETLKALEAANERSLRLGWTQLQNAGNSFAELDLMCRLYAQKKIKLRIYDAVSGPGPDADRLLKEGPAIDRCGDRLTVRTIKLYIDGALGSRGAALLAPYSDSHDSSGLLINDPQKLQPILTAALKRGIQIETHAIGDRGNRIMLDLYEKAFAAVPVKDRAVPEPRWRIEHAQIVSAQDIPRFKQLGVIASMQPSHAIGDLFFAPSRLGKSRLSEAYPWRAILDSGAIIAAGSDAPVEIGDPRIEFYAAVARRSLDGFANDDWHLDQRVSRAQALKMLTLWPAFAAFQEKQRGSIAPGKLADFSVFVEDLMTMPEPEILQARVAMTVIAGEIVYSMPTS